MDNRREFFDNYKKWRPLGLSLMIHGTLMWIFIVLIIGGFFDQRQPIEPKIRRGEIVLATALQTQAPEYLTEDDSLDPTEAPLPPSAVAPVEPTSQPPNLTIESDAESDAESAAESAAETVADLPGRPAEALLGDASAMSESSAAASFPEVPLSDDDLQRIEADRKILKSRQPIGAPTSIQLFGSGNMTGRSFVFVLDRSKSMGSSGLGVIGASRIELSRAIGALQPHHQFQIVGYHNRTVTMATRRMLPASAGNKAKVAPFIGDLVAFGGTHHENGLVVAIAFRPDVIVLLTDGGFPTLNAGQLKMIQRLAGNRTEIHCLQFGSTPEPSPPNRRGFMQQLANQNRGTYQYIDVSQWKKNIE